MLTQIAEALEKRIPLIDVSEDGLGPWSISTLKSLEKCPLKFFLDKGLKIKAPEVLNDSSAVTYIGRAAHLWLEKVSLGASLDEGLAAAKEAHFHEVTAQYWERVENLRGSISAFSTRMSDFKIRLGEVEVFPELKIGITKDLKKTGFFSKDVYFRGIIDLPISVANGDLVILDHKHGGSGDFGLRNYSRQLYSQAMLFHYGVKPVRGVQVGIHFIQNSEVMMDKYKGNSHLEGTVAPELFMDIKDAVRNLHAEGKFKYSRGTMCKYCNYKALCDDGKRGTSGKLAFVEDASKALFK